MPKVVYNNKKHIIVSNRGEKYETLAICDIRKQT